MKNTIIQGGQKEMHAIRWKYIQYNPNRAFIIQFVRHIHCMSPEAVLRRQTGKQRFSLFLISYFKSLTLIAVNTIVHKKHGNMVARVPIDFHG